MRDYAAPSQIQEGDESQVLNLVWQLIMRYQITDSGHGSKALLLSWLRRCLPDKTVTNLTTDWKDGFLLSSLVNFCDSSLIIDHLWLDSDEAFENVQNALQLAEEHFNIPQLLKPGDFVNDKPDENSIMTYLSYFCKEEGSPGQKMLLEWIQEKTNDNSITNFTDIWVDGKKLGLLVHAVSTSGFKEHGEADEDKVENCKLVMEVADKLLGVEMTVSPAQFSDRSLNPIVRMMYLLQFFFSDHHAKVHDLHIPEEAGNGATVWLDISLPEGSTKEVTASVRGKLTGELATTMHSIEDGKQQIKFDAEIPDHYAFSVSVGGMRVKGSPFTVDLTPGDPESVQLTDTDTPKKTGLPVILTFTAKESQRGNLTAEITGDVSEEVPHLIDTVSSMVYKLSFIPLQPETYTVSVKLDGVHTKGSPFTIPLNDLIQPEIIKIGEPVKGEVGELVTIPIDTKEAGDDKLTAKCFGKIAGEIEMAYNPPENPTEITFTPPQEDTYSVSIFFGTTEIPGSPFDVRIYHLPVDSKMVHLVHPPMGSVSAGTEIKIGFDTAEAGGGTMTAFCIGKHYGDVEVEVVETTNNIFTVSFTPSESDQYEITVLWSGEPVPGSPFNLNLIPKDPPDPAKCSIVGFPEASEVLLTNEEIHFTVDTTGAGQGYLDIVIQVEEDEASENEEDRMSIASTGTRGSEATNMEMEHENEDELEPIHEEAEESRKSVASGVEDQPTKETSLQKIDGAENTEGEAPGKASQPEQQGSHGDEEGEVKSDTHDVSASCEDLKPAPVPTLNIEPSEKNSKLFYVTYIPVQGGNHLMNITWSDQHISGSPFALNIHDPQHVKFMEPIAVKIKTIYKRKHLKVKLQKRNGSVVKHNVKMEKITAGDYILVFTPNTVDIYLMHVSAKGKPIPGSPFVINYFKPEILNEQLQQVRVKILPERGYVGEPVSFTVIAPDDQLLDEISVFRKCSSQDELKPVLERTKTGSLTATYTPTDEGEEEVVFKLGDKIIPGSPFRVSILTRRPVSAAEPIASESASIFGLSLDDHRFVVGTPSKFKLVCDELGEGELHVLCKPTTYADVVVTKDESREKVFWANITPKKAGKAEILIRYGISDIAGSPFVVNFLPRGSAKKCVLLGKSACAQNLPNGEKSFCVTTKGAGKGKITAVMKSITSGKKINVKVEQHTKNHYHLKFKPSEGLNYNLMVRFDDVDISGSPYKILLGNPVHCKADGEGLTRPWTGRPNTFYVDSINAGPGDLDVVIEKEVQEEEEIVKIEPTITKVEDFKHDVTYMPTLPGRYWITIKWNNTNIGGSPFMTLCRQPLSPNQLSIVEPAPIAHIGKPAEFLVAVDQVIEEEDKLTATVQGTEESERCRVEVSRKDKQSYTVTVHPSELGKYLVDILWDEQGVLRSPIEFTTVPLPSMEDFSLEAEEKEKGLLSLKVIGPEFAFRYGELTASIKNSEAAKDETPVKTTPLSDEVCTVEFKPSKRNACQLNVFYDAEHIQGSPFNLVSTDAAQCYHRGQGLISARVHQSNKFTVFTENAGPGELRVEIEAEVENEGDILLVPDVSPRENDMTYDVSYTSNFTGHYTISVFWDVHHIPGSPFNVICSDPTRYTVLKPPHEGTFGKPIKIGVRESTMGTSYEKITVFARGKDRQHHPGEVSKGSDGNYLCTVQPPELGKYVVHVRCNGYDIQGSPFKIRNMPAPIPEKVFVSGPGIEDGKIGERGLIEIDVSEAGHGFINLKVQGPKSGFNVNLTKSQDDGKILGEYNPTHTGRYYISVLWAGVHVPKSPFMVNISENHHSSHHDGGQVTMQAVG